MARDLTAAPAPSCGVVRILEVKGPKGGLVQVLLLRCGSWVTRRLKAGAAPPVSVWCIACHVRQELARLDLEMPTVRGSH